VARSDGSVSPRAANTSRVPSLERKGRTPPLERKNSNSTNQRQPDGALLGSDAVTNFATQMESLNIGSSSFNYSSSSSSSTSNGSIFSKNSPRARTRTASGGDSSASSTTVVAASAGNPSDVGWMEESAFPGLANGPLSWLSAAQEARPVTGAWKIA
jgi:hypothetical protein